jgi:anti-sigma28 factor (negative regulator of flagellin synthesis)
MKRRAILVLGALLMSATIPALAQQTNEEKVICELAAKNCLNKADILQKRVKKLKAEIKKGSTKYSAEDLKKLEQKLNETQELLDKMEGKAPAK